MDRNMEAIIEKRIEKTAENLRKNNMEVFVAENSAEAVRLMEGILNDGETITCGGSATLAESGMTELMKSGRYDFIDRSKAESREETEEMYRKAFFADAYLTSANAVTESGQLYNVDGNSNRVAAICYGPKSVIFVVGINKLVRDLDEAVKRVKTCAAPANCIRLGCETPCSQTGECVSLKNGGDMPSGCACEGRVCCNYVVSAWQRKKNRFKVIIVKESLGY
ncbi:lactate utilization protein [Ruminococcus sp. Marseille-P6503]|uniref:lactate utilization protein n=1 Tax=Ruminococcus sp. Marseille-P6503 TaxID=2364796 RepID=UPI000F51B146|nr:lactate utilization protein [Ruminococcus sp. Marseille-P6503]